MEIGHKENGSSELTFEQLEHKFQDEIKRLINEKGHLEDEEIVRRKEVIDYVLLKRMIEINTHEAPYCNEKMIENQESFARGIPSAINKVRELMTSKRDTVQLETAVSTISQEYLLEFTSEYSISEGLHPELPVWGDRIIDFPEGKRISAPKDGMPVEGTYFMEDVALLNTRRTPIQRQPEFLLCLIGLSRRYFLGDDVYPTFLYDDGLEMDLFNLISSPNPATVKIGTCPRTAHEVPLLTTTTSRVIDMEDVVATSTSSGTPSAMEKEYNDRRGHSRVNLEKEVTAIGPLVNKRRRKRDKSEMEANAPPKVLRTNHASVCPELVTRGGKSLAAMGLGVDTPSHPPVQQNGATVAGDPESKKSSSFTSFAGSPCGIYQPGCGITNSCRLDTPGVCQDAVDHMVPPGFEQEVRLLKKAKEKVAKRDQRIQAREEEIKKLDQEIRSLRVVDTEVLGLRNQTRNLETLLEAEVDMKKHEDDKVEKRCAEMDARLDALSIDFDEELYPHMLTAIASRRWVIGHGLSLAVMKCAESTKLRQVFADVVSAGIAKGMSEGLKYREDTPERIREIRPSSSQLKIPVYPKVRDPRVPWAFKEEMLLEDANMANGDNVPALVMSFESVGFPPELLREILDAGLCIPDTYSGANMAYCPAK
ncbi:hypothetical protein Tco_0877552 [Tanacetum coccineum]|uniref:Transposase (Putative), gypsy type n=1 Tax=Tanacetum coccineum TaxID=301880 RepID=A0ABQ5BVG1_9ASTR